LHDPAVIFSSQYQHVTGQVDIMPTMLYAARQCLSLPLNFVKILWKLLQWIRRGQTSEISCPCTNN